MFSGASSFNQDVSKWNVSNVTDMSFMFYCSSSFNQDVSKWDVSNVTDMSDMFYCSSSFNQDVSEWDVSNVTNMSYMFYYSSSFNQDVSYWDVSKVTDMVHTFHEAVSFNQDVSMWNASMDLSVDAMFDGALVQQALRRFCGRKSFFDNDCRAMSRVDRQDLFSAAFPWNRRKSFLIFLVSQVYLCCSNITVVDCSRSQEHCDELFDVEDMDREICRFL